MYRPAVTADLSAVEPAHSLEIASTCFACNRVRKLPARSASGAVIAIISS